jgi:hypothetical protein
MPSGEFYKLCTAFPETILPALYIVFWSIMTVIRHFALAAPLALLLLFIPAFGQEEIEPRATLKNGTQDDPALNATGTEEPILEELSDKGIYRVQFRWPQVTLNEQGAWQVEIVFLNASAPEPTAQNIPQTETNTTGASTPNASGFNDPGIVENTLAVESYDIAIYDPAGSVLWEQADQPGLGGRGTQRVDIGNYTGPVTVNITDIRPGWELGDTATAEDMTDSVSFSATVVPEFPVIAAVLAGGVAAGIGAARLRRVM